MARYLTLRSAHIYHPSKVATTPRGTGFVVHEEARAKAQRVEDLCRWLVRRARRAYGTQSGRWLERRQASGPRDGRGAGGRAAGAAAQGEAAIATGTIATTTGTTLTTAALAIAALTAATLTAATLTAALTTTALTATALTATALAPSAVRR